MFAPVWLTLMYSYYYFLCIGVCQVKDVQDVHFQYFHVGKQNDWPCFFNLFAILALIMLIFSHFEEFLQRHIYFTNVLAKYIVIEYRTF